MDFQFGCVCRNDFVIATSSSMVRYSVHGCILELSVVVIAYAVMESDGKSAVCDRELRLYFYALHKSIVSFF